MLPQDKGTPIYLHLSHRIKALLSSSEQGGGKRDIMLAGGGSRTKRRPSQYRTEPEASRVGTRITSLFLTLITSLKKSKGETFLKLKTKPPLHLQNQQLPTTAQ